MTIVYRISPVLLILFLAACGGSGNGGEMPTDLNGLRQLKKEKENAIRTIQEELVQIETRIGELDQSAKTVRKRLVTTGTATKKDFSHYVDIQGSIQPGESAMASGMIGGKILRRSVDEGQYVNRGQHIATIDTETLQKQKDELETAIELARDVYDRQKNLWDQKIGSEVQYLQAKNNVERLEKSLNVIESNLRHGVVSAPISGIVNRVFMEPGEMASPGAPIVEILTTAVVKAVADVPESYLGKVSKGDQVVVKLPALGEEIPAKVALLGASIDPTNRTFKLEVELKNSQNKYKPNLLAEIRFEDYSKKDVVVIPIELIQQEVSGEQYVMVVDRSGAEPVASKAIVKIGRSYLNEIVIEEGLSADQELILQGARNVSSGDLLDIQQSK